MDVKLQLDRTRDWRRGSLGKQSDSHVADRGLHDRSKPVRVLANAGRLGRLRNPHARKISTCKLACLGASAKNAALTLCKGDGRAPCVFAHHDMMTIHNVTTCTCRPKQSSMRKSSLGRLPSACRKHATADGAE